MANRKTDKGINNDLKNNTQKTNESQWNAWLPTSNQYQFDSRKDQSYKYLIISSLKHVCYTW
jgi:hypothetical protein